MTQSNAITANDEESLIDRVEYDMDAQGRMTEISHDEY